MKLDNTDVVNNLESGGGGKWMNINSFLDDHTTSNLSASAVHKQPPFLSNIASADRLNIVSSGAQDLLLQQTHLNMQFMRKSDCSVLRGVSSAKHLQT